MKLRRGPDRVHVRAEIREPNVWLSPVDRQGNVGVLVGEKLVRIEDRAGRVLEVRSNPRQKFPYGRRLIRWDRLDAAYFDGYALWNYLTLPAQLLREDVLWTERSEGVLEARYPHNLPTHSTLQWFHFEPESGLLCRNDYTTDVLGKWAEATWIILEHASWDGIPYVSRKKAMPRPGGHLLSFPVMAELTVHEWSMI